MNRRKGFTLIEVMIVVAILSILAMATLSALMVGQDVVTTGLAITHATAEGERVLGRIRDDLQWANINMVTLDDASHECTIMFQIPVEDAAGKVLDGNNDIRWGSYTTLGERLAYVLTPSDDPDHILVEGDTIDYNHDGDKSDVFVLARVEARTYDAGLNEISSVRICGPIIMWTQNAGNRDINGDGFSDVPFTQSGNTVAMNLWMYCTDSEDRPLLRNVTSAVSSVN